MNRYSHRVYGAARIDFTLDGIVWRAYRADGVIVLASNRKITGAQYKRAREVAERAMTFYDVALARSLAQRRS